MSKTTPPPATRTPEGIYEQLRRNAEDAELQRIQNQMRAADRAYLDNYSIDWRDAEAFPTPPPTVKKKKSLTEIPRDYIPASQLYSHQQSAMERLVRARDRVVARRGYTSFENTLRSRTSHAFERLTEDPHLSEASLRNMIVTARFDLENIDSQPASVNLEWEYRRVRVLMNVLEQRLDAVRRDRPHLLLRDFVDGALSPRDDFYGGNVRPEPEPPKKKAPDPRHSLKPLPRKMILDRS